MWSFELCPKSLIPGLNSLEPTRKMDRTAQENEKRPGLQNLEAGPAMALMKSAICFGLGSLF